MERAAILVVVAAFAACTPLPEARPGQPTISTNRPSFSNSASLVPADHFQLETGYTFTQRSQGGVDDDRQVAPEVLARYRVLDRLEAQVLWGGYAWQESEAGGARTSLDGGTDLGLALRVPIADQDGLLPQLSLQGTATLGTGRDDFSTGSHTVPTGEILWAYALDGGFGLGGNLRFSYPHDGTERFEQLIASLYATCALSERTSVFGEYFVVGPFANGSGPANGVDGGVLYLVTRSLQLDARVGFGLSDDADDFFTGVGVSFLF